MRSHILVNLIIFFIGSVHFAKGCSTIDRCAAAAPHQTVDTHLRLSSPTKHSIIDMLLIVEAANQLADIR